MSGEDRLLRDVTREVLAELLPGLLEEALARPASGNGNGNGHHGPPPEPQPAVAAADDPVPQVPAPPVAAVHRPSTWHDPSPPAVVPEAVAGSPAGESRPAHGAEVEEVDLRSDEDLDAFVRSLVHRIENPRDRMAIRSGKLRFRLRRIAAGGDGGAPVMRIEKGAVTERMVRDAADAGARLVLAPRAVLTPMARDRARSLGVQIEKERAC